MSYSSYPTCIYNAITVHIMYMNTPKQTSPLAPSLCIFLSLSAFSIHRLARCGSSHHALRFPSTGDVTADGSDKQQRHTCTSKHVDVMLSDAVISLKLEIS